MFGQSRPLQRKAFHVGGWAGEAGKSILSFRATFSPRQLIFPFERKNMNFHRNRRLNFRDEISFKLQTCNTEVFGLQPDNLFSIYSRISGKYYIFDNLHDLLESPFAFLLRLQIAAKYAGILLRYLLILLTTQRKINRLCLSML